MKENTPQSDRDGSFAGHDSSEGRDSSQSRDASQGHDSFEGHDASQDRYDFQRLERSVEYLLEEHARLGAEREAILAELADREHRLADREQRLADGELRVTQLEAEVVEERRRRAVAVEGVDKILSRLEQLQTSVALPDTFESSDDKAPKMAAQQSASGVTL